MSITSAQAHDKRIAFTSQMAHIISNAYIKSPTARQHDGFSAGSYKDMTRVAWLAPEMWAELFLENKDFLMAELDTLMANLRQYQDAMVHNDLPGLVRLLDEGPETKRGGGWPLTTIHIAASREYDVAIEPGLLTRLGTMAAELGLGRRAAVISDDAVFALYGAAAEKALTDAGFQVDHFLFPHGEQQKNLSTYGQVLNFLCGRRFTRSDFLVALGGGAVLDSAVAVAAMATNPGDLWDYVNGGTGKGQPLVNPGLPIVAITLTAGTGSEVNCWGVISNLETKEKIGFGYQELTPVLAVVDPELMKTVPAKYTAYQGFDALFHNTEVMMSNGVNILSETIALSAIENIANYLPRAVKDGNDLVAREHIAYGSTMAGIAMQLTSTTAQHSMEHAMSAYHHNLPHGAGLIMISVEFARYFIERHACDEQLIKMARVMGMPNADKPEDFITALQQLQKDCGVDDLKMSDYGIQKDECMTLAVNARETMGGLFLANPCPMSDEECAGIFEKSYR